jgi:archaellum biogenesis ATPase FlaH
MVPISRLHNQLEKIMEITMSEVVPEEVNWLWPDWIALGHLHVIAGDPDVGKSFMSCALAAIVSTGESWPDGSSNDTRGDVFMLVGEDDLGHTVRPRLDKHGADASRIHAFDSRGILRNGMGDFREALDRHPDTKLIIVDTLNDFVEIGDGNNNQDARDALGDVLKIARERNVAIVLITHTPKRDGKISRRAIDSVLGARSLCAMPRFVYALAKSTEHEDLRIIVPIKANLVERKVAKGFRIVDGMVEWASGSVDITADDLFNPKRGPDSETLRVCIDWLEQTLTADTWTPSKELDQLAKDAGFSHSTVCRARAAAGVQSKKFDIMWYCCLKSESDILPAPPTKAAIPPQQVSEDAQPALA